MTGPSSMKGPSDVPRLHQTVLGDHGDRIVFLHGLFGQGKNWTSIGKGLAEDHRVLLLDLPDHGRSDWTERLSYSAMAGAVAHTLAEMAPGERWTVIGHSMGGKVAMWLTLTRPELVERLCVVDMAPVDYHGLTSFGRYVEAMRSVELPDLRHRADAEAALTELVPDPVIRGFLLQNLRRESGPDGARWRWQMNLRLLGDQLDALSGWSSPQTAPYPGPVLWIAGADSDYVRTEYAPAMRDLFPAVRTITIKRAGHWVHAEQPEVFSTVLRRFVDQSP